LAFQAVQQAAKSCGDYRKRQYQEKAVQQMAKSCEDYRKRQYQEKAAQQAKLWLFRNLA